MTASTDQQFTDTIQSNTRSKDASSLPETCIGIKFHFSLDARVVLPCFDFAHVQEIPM